VRELENVLASAAIFADGSLITPECFLHVHELAALLDVRPAHANGKAAPLPLPRAAELVAEQVALRGEDEDEDDAGDEPSGSGASVDDVNFYELARTRGLSLKELRQQLEMQCIRRALVDADGNISEAARLLKMKRSRLSQIVNSEPELKSCRGH
jgi:DNA-binding NtrC family response regulator